VTNPFDALNEVEPSSESYGDKSASENILERAIPALDLRVALDPECILLPLDEARDGLLAVEREIKEKDDDRRKQLVKEKMRLKAHDKTGKLVLVDPAIYGPISYAACPNGHGPMQDFYAAPNLVYSDEHHHALAGVFECRHCRAQVSRAILMRQPVLSGTRNAEGQRREQENIEAIHEAVHRLGALCERQEQRNDLNHAFAISVGTMIISALMFCVAVPIIMHLLAL
jgi:hypothetical protein